MAGFKEQAERYRREQQFNRTINEGARIGQRTQAEIADARFKAEAAFKSCGLYDVLTDALSFARSVDGHKDARLEFDGAEREGVYFVASATLKWNIVPGEFADGYTYVQVVYDIGSLTTLTIKGAEETRISRYLGEAHDGAAYPIVKAYHKPAMQPPYKIPLDDVGIE